MIVRTVAPVDNQTSLWYRLPVQQDAGSHLVFSSQHFVSIKAFHSTILYIQFSQSSHYILLLSPL